MNELIKLTRVSDGASMRASEDAAAILIEQGIAAKAGEKQKAEAKAPKTKKK